VKPVCVEWVIEYWNPDIKQVERFSSEDGSWVEAPRDNIVYVHVEYSMVRPHGNPDTKYKVVCMGTDYYFLQEIDDAVYFGGFNDEYATSTSADSAGSIHRYSEGNIEREFYEGHIPPDFIDKCNVKAGVWVEEPWATMLGLSRTNYESIMVEDCCDDG
jgi:hypothetical protein